MISSMAFLCIFGIATLLFGLFFMILGIILDSHNLYDIGAILITSSVIIFIILLIVYITSIFIENGYFQ